MINELVNHTKRKTSTLLDKVNNLVQDMIHEIEDKPLPKELPLKLPKQFAFKSTQPPRSRQLNMKKLSNDEQETFKESTSISNPEVNIMQLSGDEDKHLMTLFHQLKSMKSHT